METKTMEDRYTKKEINQIVKEIRNASSAMCQALDNITWTNYYSNMVDDEIKEEKRHRDSAPDGVIFLTSTHDNAKYFCITWIIKYLLGLDSYYPDVDHYLHTKKNCFTALALAIEYGNEIIDALDRNKVDVELLINTDYCKFNYFN